MKRKINRVLIIVNRLKNEADRIISEIREYLGQRDIESDIFSTEDRNTRLDCTRVDLAFSLGGDGTVLFSARLLAPHKIPILPVNLGNFGFITEVSKTEWVSAFEKFYHGELGVGEHLMIKVGVQRNGDEVISFTGLNDGVISAAGISKIVRLYISLKSTRLGEYRADGVIIATPTGSTAYSAAAGGPILDPEMEAMIINPICPFTLSNRPLVVQGDEKIYVEIGDKQRTSLILTIDGQNVFPLQPNDIIEFRKTEEKALIIHSDKRNFYEILRTKLNWSGGPDA